MSVNWSEIDDIMYGIILGRGSIGITDKEVYKLLRNVRPSAPEHDLQMAIKQAGNKLGAIGLISYTETPSNLEAIRTYFPKE